MMSFSGELKLDWGTRAETGNKSALTQLYRSADARSPESRRMALVIFTASAGYGLLARAIVPDRL
jgi:hypothetical protein